MVDDPDSILHELVEKTTIKKEVRKQRKHAKDEKKKKRSSKLILSKIIRDKK